MFFLKYISYFLFLFLILLWFNNYWYVQGITDNKEILKGKKLKNSMIVSSAKLLEE